MLGKTLQRGPGSEDSEEAILIKKELTFVRNDIAHGRLVDISSQNSGHMLLVALLFISSIELTAETIRELIVSE